MRVQEIMDKSYPSIYADEYATRARAILREYALRMIPVVNENKKLAGIVSRGDIMAITSSISPIRVRGIMAAPRFTATLAMDFADALREMIRLDEWYVPVVNSPQDKTYTGVLGLENFIKFFLKKEFARLSRTVSEVMSTDVITCEPGDEVDNVWRLMQKKAFAGLPVIKKGRVIGMVTQKDLLETGAIFPAFESKKGRFKAPSKISSIMKTSVVSLKPDSTLKEAAEIMLKKNIGRVPVTDEKGKLVGVIDREDVVKALL